MSVSITGLDEAVKAMQALEVGLRGTAIKAGLRNVGKAVSKRLKANVPKETGALRKSIGYRVLRQRDAAGFGVPAGGAGIYIGITRKAKVSVGNIGGVDVVKKISLAHIAEWMESGTKPHVIRPRRKEALAFGAGDGKTVVEEVHHPGVKARRWVAKTQAQVSSDIPNLFFAGLEGWLNKNLP